jgi:hypothetical protein
VKFFNLQVQYNSLLFFPSDTKFQARNPTLKTQFQPLEFAPYPTLLLALPEAKEPKGHITPSPMLKTGTGTTFMQSLHALFINAKILSVESIFEHKVNA